MPVRTRDQLLEALAEQRSFLERSARDYDCGHESEAKRLAVSLRVLMHQTSSSHSLLDQLGLKKSLKWAATAGQVDSANLAATSGLVMLRMTFNGNGSADGLYIPPLGDYPPTTVLTKSGSVARGTLIDFDDWWTMPVVKDSDGRTFTRRSLVLALSNQEGGAHVDPKVQEAYDALANSNSLGWAVTDSTGERPLANNPVFGSIRQIAYEVLESLNLQDDLIV